MSDEKYELERVRPQDMMTADAVNLQAHERRYAARSVPVRTWRQT